MIFRQHQPNISNVITKATVLFESLKRASQQHEASDVHIQLPKVAVRIKCDTECWIAVSWDVGFYGIGMIFHSTTKSSAPIMLASSFMPARPPKEY